MHRPLLTPGEHEEVSCDYDDERYDEWSPNCCYHYYHSSDLRERHEVSEAYCAYCYYYRPDCLEVIIKVNEAERPIVYNLEYSELVGEYECSNYEGERHCHSRILSDQALECEPDIRGKSVEVALSLRHFLILTITSLNTWMWISCSWR